MKLRIHLGKLLSWVTLASLGPTLLSATGVTVPGDRLTGNGKVNRTVLTYSELFSKTAPVAPVDDGGFAVPANAAAPSQIFEGTLTLSSPMSSDSFQILRDDEKYDTGSDSPWRHLASFSFQFVQNGSYLIPVRQGLVITGSPAWNYIVGPGRVWQEDGDHGYMRASLPFALVERNQNCVHNGEMAFLFSNTRIPNVSPVRYQITQETCLYLKFNMWGQLPATYTPGKIAEAEEVRNAAAAEVANRLPTKPFSALQADYPNSGIDLANFTQGRQSPEDVTTYGLLVNGIDYVGGCQTRYGTYAFCDNMRLPSYSLAKSSFAGVAMMWLGQHYGKSVYEQLIRSYVPQYVDGGDWTNVTFGNTSDMATGNYINAKPEADEDSPQELAFLTAEPYSAKIADAFTPFPHQADPGTTWVYQSHATFILTQAMNGYLQQRRGRRADIFNAIRDGVFKPLHLSRGGLSMLRTDNSPTGKLFGGYGMFFIQDDIAKIGRLLNNSGGVIDGAQVLDATLLQESLFRTANASTLGVPIPDSGKPRVENAFRYHNYFWGKHMTTAEFPQYSCNFWVSFMTGYGGNSVVLLPNGATFYIFSDGNEFVWYPALNEINKIAPFCH
jgi:hypothetical protein